MSLLLRSPPSSKRKVATERSNRTPATCNLSSQAAATGHAAACLHCQSSPSTTRRTARKKFTNPTWGLLGRRASSCCRQMSHSVRGSLVDKEQTQLIICRPRERIDVRRTPPHALAGPVRHGHASSSTSPGSPDRATAVYMLVRVTMQYGTRTHHLLLPRASFFDRHRTQRSHRYGLSSTNRGKFLAKCAHESASRARTRSRECLSVRSTDIDDLARRPTHHSTHRLVNPRATALAAIPCPAMHITQAHGCSKKCPPCRRKSGRLNAIASRGAAEECAGVRSSTQTSLEQGRLTAAFAAREMHSPQAQHRGPV